MLHWPRKGANPKEKGDANGVDETPLWRFAYRLRDRNKFPRRWWFPPEQRLEFDSTEEWKRQHDEVSNTLRRVMLTLFGYSFFCMLTLAAPDAMLIAGGAKIKVPFAATEVDFVSFLIIGPLILIGLTIYLHIFLGQWLALGTPENFMGLPFLFNMTHRGARWLAGFTFYWLPPLILAHFTWKVRPRPAEALWLLCFTAFVTISLVWLQIRRCPATQRHRRNRLLWFFLITIISIITIATFNLAVYRMAAYRAVYEELIYRPLWLVGANLAKKNLQGVYMPGALLGEADLSDADLRGANLGEANLRDANLRGANLGEANLFEADLSKADLSEADLRGADLPYASLRGADLSGADLRRATLINSNLIEANLRDAWLRGANLRGVDLRDAGLFNAYLSKADLSEADLRGADLSKADLSEADLRGADLSGADLGDAKVFQKQLDNACGDDVTLKPGLIIKPCLDKEDR